MAEIEKLQIEALLKRNILLSPDMLTDTERMDESTVDAAAGTRLLVLSRDIGKIISKKKDLEVNWLELEKSKVLFEKEKNKKIYLNFIEFLTSQTQTDKNEKIKIVYSYAEESKKRTVEDFVSLFTSRFKQIEGLLRNRQDLVGLMSINRVINRKDRGATSIIGIVQDKQITKNNNLILTLEDMTGTMKVLVSGNKQQLLSEAKDIVNDEVIGVVGSNNKNMLYANKFIWPEIPHNELKKAPDKAYAVFLSDLHVGSKNFLAENFERFLNWINGDVGNEQQREIANKTEYIFIVGDLVDGIAVYPGQDEELIITDLHQQYKECAKLLSRIPTNIKIIICPGNHDGVRMNEPQPAIGKNFASELLKLPNLISVSNPAMVNIHSSEGFSGLDVLMYHGYSFDYYVANVDSIRLQGGYDRADLIMKFLLRRRHLAPAYFSTLQTPSAKDVLVIGITPDIFVTGHIHKSSVANYRNITMVCGSCWQSKTSFQERVGHHPEPSRVPIIDLQTRDVKILKFGR